MCVCVRVCNMYDIHVHIPPTPKAPLLKRDIRFVAAAPGAMLLRLSGLAKAWIQLASHIKPG